MASTAELITLLTSGAAFVTALATLWTVIDHRERMRGNRSSLRLDKPYMRKSRVRSPRLLLFCGIAGANREVKNQTEIILFNCLTLEMDRPRIFTSLGNTKSTN